MLDGSSLGCVVTIQQGSSVQRVPAATRILQQCDECARAQQTILHGYEAEARVFTGQSQKKEELLSCEYGQFMADEGWLVQHQRKNGCEKC